MKNIFLASILVLFSSVSWALGDWNCGMVDGMQVDIYAGPSLVINHGMPKKMTAYHNDGASTYYVTADGQYIWGGSAKSTRLYDRGLKFLANCKRPKGEAGLFDRIFKDNGYGGDRGPEFP